MAAAPTCPSADALVAFTAGKLSDAELVKISDHISQCDTCDSAVRGASGQEDSLAVRLRAAMLDAIPSEDSACLRMQHAAQAIRGGSGEPATAVSERDVSTGDSQSGADRDATGTVNWPPSPSLPAMIGRYHVRSVLGRGGFGTVYLAHDPDLDQLVAIKVPRFAPSDAEQLIESFLQEARTAAKLKHPGIVAVYEVGRQSDGSCYIVMEYVEGGSLAAEMAKGKLPRERAVQIVREVADALHYAHKKGFVHRDLKPGNILLDAAGHVKIADFGLAVHEDQQRSHRGELAGTLAYMSPEQLRGQVHRLDGRSDIWSLGVILYELLTGRKPFAGTRLEMADEIQHRSPKPPRQIDDTIPAELERICLKCLAKDLDQRYTSAGDVAAALQQPRHSQLIRISRWVAIALIFVIAGSISGYMMWPTSPPNGWQPLLTRQPEELIPSMGARETWSFDSTRQRVSMDSRSTTMLRLGESQHGAFKLQVAISKNTLSGRSGLLIGHRPQHSDGGRRWGCQIVFVDCGEDGRVTVQRESIDLEELRNGTMVLGRYKLATAHVPREPINQSVLEVDVRGNRIQEVRWQGRPLPELADPKTDRSGAVPTCIGQFGIVNNRGSAFFSDARIFIFRRNPL